MKTIFHPADSRGKANHGWLQSHHSFSFANWYDPQKVHFGALRVLNDDVVKGGAGFGTHPHDNMEIVSIPLEGDLRHRDSTGRQEVIREGDVQIMSAGSGITHSEINHNRDKPVKFLQIWVFPKSRNIKPRYEQKQFPKSSRINQLQTVVEPGGGAGVAIHQDAWFHLGAYDKAATVSYKMHGSAQGLYVFVLEGKVEMAGLNLERRDAMGVWDTEEIEINVSPNTDFLLIEVPMDPNRFS